jgi:hypothetical protein
LVGHLSSRSRRVDPSGRGDATRGEPSFAIIFGDANPPGPELNKRRTLAETVQTLEVADRDSASLGELPFRENGAQLQLLALGAAFLRDESVREG